MGYELLERGETFEVLTRKRLKYLIGSRVFVVEGRPRRGKSGTDFMLHGYFWVDEVQPETTMNFDFRLRGQRGRRINPREIGSEEWFGSFMQRQRNFESGLNPINDQGIVKRLEALCE